MAAKTLVPITGSVLRWAIDESGFSDEEVARRAGATLDELRAWEAGDGQPSMTQFGKLADALRRPRAAFFLPEPPRRSGLATSFRSAPGLRDHRLTPEAIREVRHARPLQEAASWLTKGAGEPRVQLPRYGQDASPVAAAAELRARTGVQLEDQVGWSDAWHALRAWRQAFEDMRVAVFFLRLGKEEVRGFSAWDDFAPIVAVNTAFLPQARIFTLAHELGHLVTRTDSACFDFVNPRRSDEHAVERWCERFAAAFLLPPEAVSIFVRREHGVTPTARVENFTLLMKIARRFKVSARAMAIMLIDLDLAPVWLYAVVEQHAVKVDWPDQSGGGGGQPRGERRLAEYGIRLAAVVLDGVQDGRLGRRDAADYLRLTLAETEDLGEILRSREGTSA